MRVAVDSTAAMPPRCRVRDLLLLTYYCRFAMCALSQIHKQNNQDVSSDCNANILFGLESK